jgi:hypothetical protein
MKSIASALVIFAVATSAAQAKCTSLKNTIFSCNTTKGKYVEVCDAGANIGYSFGKAGNTPELALQIERRRASTHQWDGMGRYISYAVNIPNGNTIYSVFSGVDRNGDEHGIEAGVNVEISGKLVASIKCLSKGVVNNMEGVNLPEEK